MSTDGTAQESLYNLLDAIFFLKLVFNGRNLLAMKTEERAHAGIFMSFQTPIEIPGVSMTNFMRAAVNARREAQGKEPLKSTDFLKLMRGDSGKTIFFKCVQLVKAFLSICLIFPSKTISSTAQ